MVEERTLRSRSASAAASATLSMVTFGMTSWTSPVNCWLTWATWDPATKCAHLTTDAASHVNKEGIDS